MACSSSSFTFTSFSLSSFLSLLSTTTALSDFSDTTSAFSNSSLACFSSDGVTFGTFSRLSVAALSF